MKLKFPRTYSVDVLQDIEVRRKELRKGTLQLNGRISRNVFAAGTVCGTDTSWTEWWTELGELLLPIVYYLNSNVLPSESQYVRDKQMQSMLAFAGSPDRLIHNGLDGAFRSISSEDERGRQILRSIVRSTDGVLKTLDLQVGTRIDNTAAALTAEDVEKSTLAVEKFRWVILRRLAEVIGIPGEVPPAYTEEVPNSETIKFVWLRGILQSNPTLSRLPGVRALSHGIAENIATDSGLTAIFDENDPFAVLTRDVGGLPSTLAAHFSSGTNWLKGYRDRARDVFGYENTGINDPGTTALDRIAFRFIFNEEQGRSFVVLAPTSSGKSRLGQMGVAEAIHRRHSEGHKYGCVLFLVPTKALVNQVARDLRELFSGADTRNWLVLEGSRDYPQYDDQIRLTKFDVAVCIPEKLSAFLRVGMPLRETPLIVIDELQHLVDEGRGQSLELLMIQLFDEYPSMRWIGLSASLSEGTQDLIVKWFRRNGVDIPVLRSDSRPVPLTLIAANSHSAIEYVEHDRNSVTHRTMSLPSIDTKFREKELKRTLDNHHDLLKFIAHLFAHTDAEVPSILVFTNSRRLAENLATVFAVVVSNARLLPPVAEDATPFLGGRFQEFENGIEPHVSPEELLREFSFASPGRLRDATESALRIGIGFHTSTLDWGFRDTVENAFRLGYIRLLFATDTLKLGVNLPADIVINADFLLNTGSNRQRLMDKDSIIQRIGRAGRLGVTRGMGTGYLWVPEKLRRIENFQFDIGIDERIGLGGSAEASDSAVIAATTDVEKAFHYYLHQWGGGADHTLPLNDMWLLDAITRALAQLPALRIDSTELADQAKELFGKSFSGVMGRLTPDDSISRLERAGVIQIIQGTARLTRLGRAAAMNSLGIAAAPLIEQLAKAAESGAGPFTLLYHVCLSPTSYSATFQMQCRDNTPPGIRAKIVGFAQQSIKLTRAAGSETAAYFRLQSDSTTDVIGNGILADELRNLLTIDNTVDIASDEQITALWRSTTLLHWWGGAPFQKLETKIGGEQWLVGETDLRQLAENVSNTIAAASDYLGTDPKDMTFRSLLLFSQEIETGLPTVLSSLVRLNERAMHRERLIGLLPILFDPDIRWDNLPELLEKYFTDSEGRPARTRNWQPLTPAIVERVAKHLHEQQKLIDDAAFSVPDTVSADYVPKESSRTISDHLKSFDTGSGVMVLEDLIDAFALEQDSISNGELRGTTVRLPDGLGQVILLVANQQVTQATVDCVIASLGNAVNAMIIATKGSTAGVVHHSRFMTERCAVVEPSLFLEMIARVYRKFESEPDVFGDTTPDIAASARLLARMLLNNAPVLTRSDLESRLRHDDLVD